MSLKKYLSKRKLKESHEPPAKIPKQKKGELHFVVQKHAASRLHYDLRLEVDGVLKSWAVPKGPSLDPSIKHLAIQVEDHPYDYCNFEGIIPRGYGAGTVMIWDQGTYTVDDASRRQSEALIREGLKKGAVHFTLNGEKLKGRFSLVKLKTGRDEWILIKTKDEFASKEEIIQKDRSVVSGKNIEEISGKTTKERPHALKPMLCTLIDQPFDSTEWLFEIKLDGFRALAELNGKKVEIYSRNLQTFNERFPQLVQHLKALNLDAVLDGEIVALDAKGVSHFQWLQNDRTEENIYFYVFDILYLKGRDLRSLPLIERKSILKNILKNDSAIRYLDHIEDFGKKFFQACKKQGLEGIIGKKKESSYATGERSKAWVKIKAELRQEAVICGFTEPKRSRKNFGALIIGVYKNNVLHFAGHVGGGFTEKKLEEVKDLLSPYITKKCPFQTPPKTNTSVTWVEPRFICEVKFKEWTTGGNMRMPIFLGMRADKPVRAVKLEKKMKTQKLVSEKYDFITHPDKLYWEQEQITKGDVLHYYESIAPFILPYLKDRPESLKRFPNGISEKSFFQKNLTTPPEWLKTTKVIHHDKTVNYMMIQDVRSLLFAVNLGCIEIHPWFSRIQNLENPDFLIFDLDPEDVPFDHVVETAQALHALLDAIQVPSYCKTSGGRGLHIGVPLKALYTYEQAKQFAELIALLVHQKLPQIISLERSPKRRQKRVYIDCYQNNFGQTLAAPYSLRAKPGAPVATPLEWKEVKKGLDPAQYTLFNTLERLKKKGDLFKPLLQKGIHLEKSLKRLQGLFEKKKPL